MLFDTWNDVLRTATVGVLAYAVLIAVLRLSGNRTLAKMNAFDLVITVALGSTLATILLSSEVSLAEGAAALSLLVVLQFINAWSAVRSHTIRRVIKSWPVLLLRDGQILKQTAQDHRVTIGEIHQAIRAQGHGHLNDIAAVVLETDGTFSVIPQESMGSGTALSDVGTNTSRTGKAPGSR